MNVNHGNMFVGCVQLRLNLRGVIHPKAMPVILTKQEEIETWLTAEPAEALKLQRPLPGGSLSIVARGVKEDAVTGTAT